MTGASAVAVAAVASASRSRSASRSPTVSRLPAASWLPVTSRPRAAPWSFAAPRSRPRPMPGGVPATPRSVPTARTAVPRAREPAMSELITAELVDLDLSAETKDAAARSLAERMAAHGRVTDLEGFLADVAAREAQMPTGLGQRSQRYADPVSA
ncbi:Phosphoenolpyruvate-dependent sugar phosphotransferase system, EIIA 2 [Streptomyces sp. 2112.3]|nr:Phosphoenolpyruvate-dependent sugar phosphotransferase system, EIIA 2 [Streptomyces sp. 2112.3]